MPITVLLHILIALSSLVFTTYLAFAPTRAKLLAGYLLVGLTLVSGTYLVVTTGTHILQTCATGLVYLGVVSVGLVAARHKLDQIHG